MNHRTDQRPPEHRTQVIGVISGMGPYAGLDLVRKIFDQTQASKDQDHLPVALISYPDRINDRSTFLFGHDDRNPAFPLAEIARQLASVGAVVAAMPCNTAHMPPIWDALQAELQRTGHRVRLVHMIEEMVRFLTEEVPGLRRVGLLSTLATYRFRLYQDALEAAGLEAVLPPPDMQEHVVNRTIFEPPHGIKAQGNPISPVARQSLLDTIAVLRDQGAEAVILGCTELPLAVTEREINGVPILDPTLILARALIRETHPQQLRPLPADLVATRPAIRQEAA